MPRTAVPALRGNSIQKQIVQGNTYSHFQVRFGCVGGIKLNFLKKTSLSCSSKGNFKTLFSKRSDWLGEVSPAQKEQSAVLGQRAAVSPAVSGAPVKPPCALCSSTCCKPSSHLCLEIKITALKGGKIKNQPRLPPFTTLPLSSLAPGVTRGQSHLCPLLPTGFGAVPERKGHDYWIMSWIQLWENCCHHVLEDFENVLLPHPGFHKLRAQNSAVINPQGAMGVWPGQRAC